MRHPVWLIDLMQKENLTDLLLSSSNIQIDRGNGIETLKNLFWCETEIKNWVLHQLTRVGKSWDAKAPYLDCMLPTNEEQPFLFRMHVIFPPLSPSGIQISLRKNPENKQSPTSFWRQDPYFHFLSEKVLKGDAIIISGATGSGKTTLLNELIDTIPQDERIIALEDTAELNPKHPNFVRLLSRPQNNDGFGEVTLRTLLKQSLRMRPDRILLGECRGSETLDLLQTLNTGHRGAMATVHAKSARETLKRLELLCLLSSNSHISTSVIRELLVFGIQWIVHVQRTSQGRQIREVFQVMGREGDTITLRPQFLPLG